MYNSNILGILNTEHTNYIPKVTDSLLLRKKRFRRITRKRRVENSSDRLRSP